MQPFDDTLYSGYSTYNNWKVPSTPSSLAKAGFAWGLTGSSFNMNSNPLGSTSYGPNNSNYGSMYSAVVSASSSSPTSTADNSGGSKTESNTLHQYPPMPKLKSSPLLKDSGGVVVENTLNRSPLSESGGGSLGSGVYNPLV